MITAHVGGSRGARETRGASGDSIGASGRGASITPDCFPVPGGTSSSTSSVEDTVEGGERLHLYIIGWGGRTSLAGLAISLVKRNILSMRGGINGYRVDRDEWNKVG